MTVVCCNIPQRRIPVHIESTLRSQHSLISWYSSLSVCRSVGLSVCPSINKRIKRNATNRRNEKMWKVSKKPAVQQQSAHCGIEVKSIMNTNLPLKHLKNIHKQGIWTILTYFAFQFNVTRMTNTAKKKSHKGSSKSTLIEREMRRSSLVTFEW